MPLDFLLISTDLLLFAANVLFVVLVLSVVGLTEKYFIRKFSAPFQHSLLVGIVALLLLTPVLVWVAGSFQLGLISVPVQESIAQTEPEMSDVITKKNNNLVIQEPVLIPKATKIEALSNVPPELIEFNPNVKTDPAKLPLVVSKPTSTLPSNRQTVESDKLVADNDVAISWWQVVGSILIYLWGIRTLFVFLRSLRGWKFVRRLQNNMQEPTDLRMQQEADEIALTMGVSNVPVKMSSMVPVPITLGLLRPVIVMPATHTKTILSDAQLHGILRHEIAHVIRHDLWIGMVQHLAGILFWWSFSLSRLNERISELCEQICDDIVMQSKTDPRDYGLLLLEMASHMTETVESPALIGLLKSKEGHLQKRISNLLNKERDMTTQLNRTTKLLLTCAGLLLTVGLLFSTVVAEDLKNTNDQGQAFRDFLPGDDRSKERPSPIVQPDRSQGEKHSVSGKSNFLPVEKIDPFAIEKSSKKKLKYQIRIHLKKKIDGNADLRNKPIRVRNTPNEVTNAQDAITLIKRDMDILKKKGIKPAEIRLLVIANRDVPLSQVDIVLKQISQFQLGEIAFDSIDRKGFPSSKPDTLATSSIKPAEKTTKKQSHLLTIGVALLRDRKGNLLHETPVLFWKDGQVTKMEEAKSALQKELELLKKKGIKSSEVKVLLMIDNDVPVQHVKTITKQLSAMKVKSIGLSSIVQKNTKTDAAGGPTIHNLLKQIDPDKHLVGKGIWRVKDDKVIAYPAAHGSRLRIPLQTPEKSGSYVLTANWSPKTTDSHVAFMLPHGQSVASFEIMGSFLAAGIGDLNGVRPDINETKKKIDKLKPGYVYHIEIRVEYDEKEIKIVAIMDGKGIVDWKGKRSELKETYFAPSKPASFGLSVAGQASTFHSLYLQMTKGKTSAWKKLRINKYDIFQGSNGDPFGN